MKTQNFEQAKDFFLAFAISNEEMICVRGGEDDPVKPIVPPVKL
jgi:hypothetical protein